MAMLREFKWHLRTMGLRGPRPLCGAKTSRHLPYDQLRLVTCDRCLSIFAVKKPRATAPDDGEGATTVRPGGPWP